jgi:hypothetical protein
LRVLMYTIYQRTGGVGQRQELKTISIRVHKCNGQ